MAVDHLVRQAEGHTEFSHLILKEFAQRLEQLEAQLLRQAANVVVSLDGHSLFILGTSGLDHVRVNGALGQPLGALVRAVRPSFETGCFGLKDFNEFAADDLALGFGFTDAGQMT